MNICLKIESMENVAKIAALNIISSIIIADDILEENSDMIGEMFPKIPVIYDCLDNNNPIDALEIMKQKRDKLIGKIGFRDIIFPIKLDFDGIRILNQIKQTKSDIKTMPVIHPRDIMKVNVALELNTDIILLKSDYIVEQDKLLNYLEQIKNIRNSGQYNTKLLSDKVMSEYTEEIMISNTDLYRELS